MKKSISFLLVVAVTVLLSGFSKKNVENPPGTIQFEENLFIDKSEIRNIDYREYLYWIKANMGETSQEYLKALPDDSQKIKLLFHGNNKIQEMNLEYYFKHPSFNNYPLVAISYEQAFDYCIWRTDRVNETIFRAKNKKKNSNELDEDIPKVFKYRLPTKNEWISVAKRGYDLKYREKIEKENRKYMILGDIMITGNFSENGHDITEDANSGYANNIGCFNLYGNVAEMLDIEGIAVGGYYGEKLADFQIDKEYHYDSPTSWIGFRCVAERIIE
jgi:formylglycine-generating enzyme required for sulfatase activity